MQIEATIETLLFLKETLRPVKSNKVYMAEKRGCRNTHYSTGAGDIHSQSNNMHKETTSWKDLLLLTGKAVPI